MSDEQRRAAGCIGGRMYADFRSEALGAGRPHRLAIPDSARRQAAALLAGHAQGRPDGATALIGVHPSGGRAIKQWDARSFAEAANQLLRDQAVTIVLTGSADDRPLVEDVKRLLSPPERVIDLAGAVDLVTLAAVLEHLAVLVTADTGPMHLAAAVGTPVVAVFGPSDPARYAPLATRSRIVRVDLPCSPCNRIRQPPARCRGGVPDCLRGVSPARVCEATLELLEIEKTV